MGLRVFLVDDLSSTRVLMQDMFEAVGDVRLVATCTSEAEANLWLDEHPGEWDVAVVDLILETGSGLGVITRCRRNHEAGRVVVFSGYLSPTLRAHCIRLGADAVFAKEESEAFVAWFAQALGGGAMQAGS